MVRRNVLYYSPSDIQISMFCMNRKCNRKAPLPDDMTVCPDCGYDSENIDELHALITCEVCGEENSQSSLECWNCSTTLIVSSDRNNSKFVCEGCGRPRSPLTSECPTCGKEELSTTDAQLVQCGECEEFNEPQNSECWSCSTSL